MGTYRAADAATHDLRIPQRTFIPPSGPRLAESIRSKSISSRSSRENRIHFHWLMHSEIAKIKAAFVAAETIDTRVLSVTPYQSKMGRLSKTRSRATIPAKASDDPPRAQSSGIQGAYAVPRRFVGVVSFILEQIAFDIRKCVQLGMLHEARKLATSPKLTLEVTWRSCDEAGARYLIPLLMDSPRTKQLRHLGMHGRLAMRWTLYPALAISAQFAFSVLEVQAEPHFSSLHMGRKTHPPTAGMPHVRGAKQRNRAGRRPHDEPSPPSDPGTVRLQSHSLDRGIAINSLMSAFMHSIFDQSRKPLFGFVRLGALDGARRPKVNA
ncbi:hypothetical protein FQN51_000232 [Onygenales sp. PD_10]|nr:hypothetical protein FQN51_000232 [Onygenales sp. PD_10]